MAIESADILSQSGVSTEKTDQGSFPLRSNQPAPPPSNVHIARFTVFLILEAAFISLAWYCYVHPIPLPESLGHKETTVKSGFIVFFSVWHTIAVTCAYNICSETFSREWAAVPGDETDAVSTVTSGFIDRILYFPQPRATKTYRAALLAFLGLLLLRTIGSSSITVSSGITFSQSLPIGLISTASITRNLTDLESKNFLTRLDQASMVVRLERLVKVPWGYEPEQHWFIPLPNEDALQSVDKVAYNTDLVHFDYTCHWRAPGLSLDTQPNTFTLENEPWSWHFLETPDQDISLNDTSRIINGSSIVQLLPVSDNPTHGTSVFLILGGNSSFPVNSTNTTQGWVDLSGLPSLYSPEGFVTYDPTSLRVDYVRAPLASLLICNPQLNFTTGSVILDPVANITALDVTLVAGSLSRPPSPRNIEREAAGTLFTSVLTLAIGLQDVGAAIDYLNINTVATQMLLQGPVNRNWANASAVQPFDIKTINENVDNFTRSALKAFTSDYNADFDNTFAEGGVYETPVDAYSTRLSLVLATSVQFAIVHTVLFVISGIILAVVTYLNVTRPRFPFSLEHVKQA